MQQRLDGHIVVCGFGHSGRTAAAELVRRGSSPQHIVVVDQNEHLLQEAATAGHVGLKGDATMERVLRDDTNAREEEDAPLLRQAGANVTVSPSQISGFWEPEAMIRRGDLVLALEAEGARARGPG
jgi:voltage-gated potassium channel Kch